MRAIKKLFARQKSASTFLVAVDSEFPTSRMRRGGDTGQTGTRVLRVKFREKKTERRAAVKQRRKTLQAAKRAACGVNIVVLS
jgi:hypothetical protein